MIEIVVYKQIKLSGLPLKIKNHIKGTLRLKNPAYEKVIRVTGSRYAAQQWYKFYEEDKEGNLYVPRGFRDRVIAFLDKIQEPYIVKESIVELRRKDTMKRGVELRKYQVPIVEEAISHREGIINMSTGSGKTVVGLEIAFRLGLTTTILVPNTVLLQQFVEECKRFYHYTPGIIGDGKKTIKDVTVATFQSLQADTVLAGSLIMNTSVLIVDECQGAISPEREKLLKKFYPKYWYGLTATPKRSKDDGRTEAVGFWFGPIVASYEATQLSPEVHVVRTDLDIDVDDYPRMVDAMVEHPNRNRLIAGLAVGEAVSGRKVLVLVKRISHYKAIQGLLPVSDSILYIESSDKGRNELLRALKQGEKDFQIILGTTSLLAVGTDVPALDTLIIACDIKSDVLAIQSAGRILRLFEGKQNPRIIDLWDNKNPIFTRQHWERKNVYVQKKWKVI